jgi:RNA polymerase sigma factor (sigma-70 family)
MLTALRQEIGMDSRKEQWLENLMDEYGDRLTKLAFSYLKDWGKAQEVVQDVFLTCYREYDTAKNITVYKAWVYRITINRCKDVLKSFWLKRVFVTNSLFADTPSKEASPEIVSINNEVQTDLLEGVFRLPVKYREVILLFYYEELSVQEISELLHSNPNTVKTRLKRGRDRLGDLLRGSDRE